MKKQYLIKSLLMILLCVTILTFGYSSAPDIPGLDDKGLEDGKQLVNTFTNDFFTTDLEGEIDENYQAEDYIKYTEDIHSIIVTAMENPLPDGWDNEDRDIAMRDAILATVGSKKVGIFTAEDLYNFSIDCAYNWKNTAAVNSYPNTLTIQTLLSLHYVLLSDIDYSTMRAKKFIPIGIDFEIKNELDPTQNITHKYPFTGSFDGQGFMISNLYLADYSYLYMTHRWNDDESTDVDLPTAPYYSFFASVGETGKICNLIISDPIYDLLDAPDGLTQTAVFVGSNAGLIYNSAVIDTRTDAGDNDISGIRFNVSYGSSSSAPYTAAGFVHTNQITGRIFNSYYVSKNVMAVNSRNRFDIKPFVYNNLNPNNSDFQGLSYETLEAGKVDSLVQPVGVKNYSYEQLTSGFLDPDVPETGPINLNEVTIPNEVKKWVFYVEDGYPVMYELEFDEVNNYFIINDEYDLVAFSKLISKQTEFRGIPYNRYTYVLTNDIDMSNIPEYRTPAWEFAGELRGGTTDFTTSSLENENSYIFNLKITQPYIQGTNYYQGLVGILTGTIKNINFNNCSLTLSNTADYYGRAFYIGLVAAQLQGGTVKNIVSNSSIDLGTEALGRTYAGGIVGYGYGNISYVANTGSLNGNEHDFSKVTVNGTFCIGGIIGSSAEENLKLAYAYNSASVTGVGCQSTFAIQTGSMAHIRVGGIIGHINNQTENGNSLYYVTNDALLTAKSFSGTSTAPVTQYLGGIFGDCTGFGNRILEGGSTIRNGRWENNGNIAGAYTNTYTYYYSAGIGISSTESTKAEFSYMVNSGELSFTDFDIGTHNQYIYYASTIIDKSTGGILLSRAYNERSYVYGSQYFTNSQGFPTIPTIQIAPFFLSLSSAGSELLYCQNNGSLTIGYDDNNPGTDDHISVTSEMKIAGITLSPKIDFRNVYMTGNITALNITQGSSVYIAGIAWILPYDTGTEKEYFARNCMNEGNIITAEFNGNTVITNPNGHTTPTASSYGSTLDAKNIYVAGLFNINVGDVDNCMNRGDISSTLTLSNPERTIRDITGTGNTYVGGIVTFNYNHIQDCANSGNINYTNSNASSFTYVAGGDDPSYTSRFGGLVFAFNGGLTLGGIAAAFGDTAALVLQGYGNGASVKAEILDTANNGNVYGKALQYVRCGGILGVALGNELTAGTYSNDDLPFSAWFSSCITSSSISGTADPIGSCILSNGLNFGYIGAVTSKIGAYSDTNNTTGENDSSANSERPGIFACAGGIIGYGMCIMKRMLNHGVVSSTDVAGGIVGATYILGGTSSSNYNINTIDIDTAVHYGKVKAIKKDSYATMEYSEIEDIEDLNFFYEDGNTFIFPVISYNLSLYPNDKRGFGGIFGRLQRGGYGLMQSDNFINIINMDEAVDMVGRADQSSYGSYFYFRFSVHGRLDTYYTARDNDTTPACLVGYSMRVGTADFFEECSQVTFRIYHRSGQTTYTIDRVTITGGSGFQADALLRKVGIYLNQTTITNAEATDVDNTEVYIPTQYLSSFSDRSHTLNYATDRKPLHMYGLTVDDVDDLTYSNSYANFVVTDFKFFFGIPVDFPTGTTITQYNVEEVTDDPVDEPNSTFIFGEDFPLIKDPDQSNYIYQAEFEVLADLFRDPTKPAFYRENGMYVLASTAGREFGAVLPANFKVGTLFKLDEINNSGYINLNDVPPNAIISEETDPNVYAILSDYRSMFQIRYNDKSLILDDDTNPLLADIILYDPFGDFPILRGGEIDYGTNTITFTLSKDAFSTVAFTNLEVTYYVYSAGLSENAVIAKTGITDTNHAGFKTAYENRISNIIDSRLYQEPEDPDGPYVSKITGEITNGTTRTIGIITVYSEIAAMIDTLVDTYYSNYSIEINCLDSPIVDPGGGTGIVLDSVFVDGISAAVPNLVGFTYTVTSHMLRPAGTIEFVFTAPLDFLGYGHQLTFSGLYLGSTPISSDYFSIILEEFGSDGNLGITATLSDSLIAGTYTIKYQYYDNVQEYNLVFTKDSSTEKKVTAVSYESYSSDPEGTSTVLIPTQTDFETFIGFNIKLPGVPFHPSEVQPTFIEVTSAHSYLCETLYYHILVGETEIARIWVSPFASLKQGSLRAYYDYDTETEIDEDRGKRFFVLEYVITDEKGTDSEVITQTITERNPPIRRVYKNGNREYGEVVKVAREDLITNILIDFGLNTTKDNLRVVITNINGVYTPNPDGSDMSFGYGTFYQIDITSEVAVDIYSFDFYYKREGEIEMSLGSIDIEKVEGVDAYLRNINFQVGGYSTRYPVLSVWDPVLNVEVDTEYEILAYYDGIDYDGADRDGLNCFRIKGELSDIQLEYYKPDFTAPIGATIYRFDGYDEYDNEIWVENLEANYIDEFSVEGAIIRYKIVSENGDNSVEYFISAIDVTYNISIRFKLFYQSGSSIVPIQTSALSNRVVIINVKNYALKEKDENGDPIVYETIVEGNHTIFPYEGTITDYIDLSINDGLNNRSTMFYFPHIPPAGQTSNYLYTFGKNMSGCFGFSVVTPIYYGTTTENLVNGHRYTYSIFQKKATVEDHPSQWATSDYILPELDPEQHYVGKYFYIKVDRVKQIILDFYIVIHEDTEGFDWGLSDDKTSWDYE